MRDLIYELCGGMPGDRTLKAVIPGGSSVPVLNKQEAESCILDYEGCIEKGTMLGSGGMIVFDDRADMVYQMMRIARFYAHESCGQCTPCREGCGWMAKVLHRIENGEGKDGDVELILDVCDNMLGRTICPLADAAVMPAQSFIWKFREEFDGHLREKNCPYGNRF